MDADDDQLPEKTNPPLPASDLLDRVSGIIESARERVVQSVNHELVLAYWSIGREIVTELQQGDERAEYGKQLIKQLSTRLEERFGKGYSERNLELFRRFYLTYKQRLEIPNTLCSELPDSISHTVSAKLPPGEKGRTAYALSLPNFQPNLSWSHYRVLMRVENRAAHDFYESEAARQSWSVRQLERQVHTLFYERILKSSDKQGMLQASQEENAPLRPIDVLKDPYVLEFLDLPESSRLQESELETALVSSLQAFLLELGSGFAFVARQKRITLDGDHYYPDLIFYHIRLRCYVVIDLKVEKLSHADLDQMQMYVGYFDREVRASEENPTIGLVLCSEKNDAMVRYVLGEGNEQIFASRYRLQLPDEETLRRELERERALIKQAQATDSQDSQK